VYVQSVPAGRRKVQISAHGGAQPIWRRDGKELFCRDADGGTYAVPVKMSANSFEAGAPQKLFTALGAGTPYFVRRQYSVMPDGQRFLMNVPAREEQSRIVLLQNWLGRER